MKNKIIIYMILMVGLFFSCLENKYEQYSTLETLNEKEIRWIPFFLVENPNIKKQVFDIYERHDLDTNESWGKFSVIDNDYILGLKGYNKSAVKKYLKIYENKERYFECKGTTKNLRKKQFHFQMKLV